MKSSETNTDIRQTGQKANIWKADVKKWELEADRKCVDKSNECIFKKRERKKKKLWLVSR